MATLTPNKCLLPFTQPIPTQPISEVSTMADSLSPMTLNETDQISMNKYDCDNETKTNAAKAEAYMEEGAAESPSSQATTHQTSPGV